MDGIPLYALLLVLFALICLAAFFAGSETGLMMLNRYRLKHAAKQGSRSAQLAQSLLERPDRLIGLILLGNVLTSTMAASVALIIGFRLGGEAGAAIAPVALTFVLLIFAEAAPKTLAALYPERVGQPSAFIYWPLQKLLYPVLVLVNLLSNGLLRLFGVSPEDAAQHSLSAEELRSVVAEAGAMIPQRHQRMLLSILDLERATVEDIMIPRNEIIGIDISEPWERTLEVITGSSHTRLPVFDGSIDELKGVVHLRKLVRLAAQGELRQETLLQLVRDPYFIPEGTPLNQQLLNFQDQKRRIGFVVDEYGDIQGLVTLEDILEEVVGEFTSDPATRVKNVYLDADGSVLVHGSVTVRSLNRSLGWKLPTGGPKTLNGLVLEKLQELPKPGRRLEVGNYQIEITDTRANAVKTARIRPATAAASTAAAAAATR
ncbi:MAG TPA: HlyC/CorC family transporter [Nevskia sp.]|nr:HlyC/CorC family transporter [Nevskia sp.]